MVTVKGSFCWPDGAAMAFSPHTAWEMWPEDLGTMASRQHAKVKRLPASAQYPIDSTVLQDRAFAETGGVQRLMALYDEFDLRASIYVSGHVVRAYPELARAVRQRGHEFVAQPWEHEYPVVQNSELEHRYIADTVTAFEDVLALKPRGYTAPGGMFTGSTFRILAELGFEWVSGFRNVEVPFFFDVDTRDGVRRLLGMNNFILVDYASYKSEAWSAGELADMVCDDIRASYEEGLAGRPKLVSFGTHPFLCRGGRVKNWRRIFELISELPKVWVATRSEVFEWMKMNFYEQTLEAIYGQSAVASELRYEMGIANRSSDDGQAVQP